MCEACQIGFSHDEIGYVVPKFNLDLGTRLTVAKSVTGATDLPAGERHLAVMKGGSMTSMNDTSLESARLNALGGGTILRSVAKNSDGLVIWEKIEKIDDDDSGARVDSQGVVLCKVARPGDQIASIASQLANELVHQDRVWVKPYLEKYLAQLDDIDWTTEKDIVTAFARAERILKKADVQKLFEPWTKRVEVYSKASARDGRQWLRQSFLPRISGRLTGPDNRAVERVSTQQGWWLRDQMGKRSERLTVRGREIVQAGLKDGLGRQAIADQLRLAMPDLWNKYGNQYAQVNAAVAVNRARSFSMVHSYQEAGIQELEVVAVLDERTTEQCRFMDGQILVVDDVGTVMNNIVDMKRPEDIYQVNPFIHIQRNDRGVKELVTARGDKLAEVIRSGVGFRDDRGAHRQFVSGRNMPTTTAIGMPPYHHLCRTTTIPRFRMFQVPSNYMVRSAPGPSPIPATIAGVTKLTTVRAIRPTDRPLTMSKEPTPTHPVDQGYRMTDPDDPYLNDGLLEFDLRTQLEERIRRALAILAAAVGAAVEKNNGRSVTQEKKGTALRRAILNGAGSNIPLEKADREIRLSDRQHGDMSYFEQRKIIKLIESVLGDRLLSVVSKRTFPRIIEFKGNATRPRGSWDGEVLTLPKVGSVRGNSEILGTVARYLDTFEKNGRAGVLARNGSVIGNDLHQVSGDSFLTIRGADWMAGRVVGDPSKIVVKGPWNVQGGSPIDCDWSSVGLSALTDGQQSRLALLWDMNPDHVSFIASYVEGQFV